MSIEAQLDRLSERLEDLHAAVAEQVRPRLAYSFTEAAGLLGMSADTFRRLRREGHISEVEVPDGTNLIAAAELERFLNAAAAPMRDAGLGVSQRTAAGWPAAVGFG